MAAAAAVAVADDQVYDPLLSHVLNFSSHQHVEYLLERLYYIIKTLQLINL